MELTRCQFSGMRFEMPNWKTCYFDRRNFERNLEVLFLDRLSWFHVELPYARWDHTHWIQKTGVSRSLWGGPSWWGRVLTGFAEYPDVVQWLPHWCQNQKLKKISYNNIHWFPRLSKVPAVHCDRLREGALIEAGQPIVKKNNSEILSETQDELFVDWVLDGRCP